MSGSALQTGRIYSTTDQDRMLPTLLTQCSPKILEDHWLLWRDEDGNTIFHWAARKKLKALELLLSVYEHANLNVANLHGETVLMAALYARSLATVKYVLACGGDAGCIGRPECPFHHALMDGPMGREAALLLLQHHPIMRSPLEALEEHEAHCFANPKLIVETYLIRDDIRDRAWASGTAVGTALGLFRRLYKSSIYALAAYRVAIIPTLCRPLRRHRYHPSWVIKDRPLVSHSERCLRCGEIMAEPVLAVLDCWHSCTCLTCARVLETQQGPCPVCSEPVTRHARCRKSDQVRPFRMSK